MTILRICCLSLLFLLACSCTNRVEDPAGDRAERVTSLFSHLEDGIQPGAAVIVISGGEVVYSRGFGYADLEKRIPITADSSFRLGSVSKQFTATAIMMLAEAGKLDYDDPIIDYLPQLSKYPGVTIRHLLTHTAGLPDYYEIADTLPDVRSNADLANVLAAIDGPVFAPGERYEYSNSAYEMLSLIVEKVSGMPFREFMAKQLFPAAGMDNSLIHDHTEPEVPNRVYGYDRGEDGYALNDYDPWNGVVGSGSMYATLEDFIAWDRALDGEALVRKDTWKIAHSSGALSDGSDVDYGFGWGIERRHGHRRLAHTGSWVGFRNAFARYPDDRLTIVVLSNRSEFEAGAYLDSIGDIYLARTDTGFSPADTQAAVQAHHRRVPTDDIWWTVPGEQMAWMHRNAHPLFPTVNVYRNGPVRQLEHAEMAAIGNHLIDTAAGPMPFDVFLNSELSTAMGVVIVHEGKIVFERYPQMEEYEKPIYWSVAKVFPGAIIRILEERGEVDVGRMIDFYIPELAESEFAGITVRNILDMASGLDCQDEYTNRQSCYYRYSMAIGDGFRDESAPDNPYDFLAKLKVSKHAEEGTRFSYSGVNTFLLGWLVEKLTGFPFQDALTNEIWHHIGAESDASYIAYRYGIPLTHGGFLSRMRDLARFGLLYTPSYGVVSDRRIISAEHVEFIRSGGNPSLLTSAGSIAADDSGIKHNIYQWDQVFANGNFYKGGWGGQGLIVNPDRDVVAVFTSHFKEDYSEQLLEPVMFELLDAVFGQPQ